MKLNNLTPAAGSTKTSKRLGRGQGSGKGGTATRGTKGAQARAGYEHKIGFEGGQMPIQRRLPKFGFTNPTRVEYTAVNVATIQAIAEASKAQEITVDDIDKLLEQKSYQVKIDLKEAPEDRQVFVKDLFDFATMRRKEKVVIPCEHELNNMMEDYEELLGKLDRINNEEDREKLEEMLNYLIEILKESDHSVIGWHDIFFFYSFHAVELAHDYLDSKDLINVQFDLGLYCYETKRYNLAEAYYNRVLDILFEDQDSDPLSIEQLMTLTNLLFDMGILMNKLNRYKEAESYYNMLIGEKDSFISLDRDFFRPLLADTYRNLAILYRKTNRLKEAKEMAVEAYVIYKRLTRKDSKQWKKTLENTGNLLDDIEARLER